jgi:saccharopine dehydrogenase-like NADP-dependent oxidoreductase
MVTTSYVSPEMKELDAEAKEAGIIILNEIGVDPGFDHMTAMRIIDKVKSEGGKIKKFYSICGALAAPEEVNNQEITARDIWKMAKLLKFLQKNYSGIQ